MFTSRVEFGWVPLVSFASLHGPCTGWIAKADIQLEEVSSTGIHMAAVINLPSLSRPRCFAIRAARTTKTPHPASHHETRLG